MFTAAARWDRDLPNRMPDKTNPSIQVTSIIQEGHILPQSFQWNKKIYPISKINFFWKDKQGKDQLYFYSVQTQAGTYEIAFSKETLSWRIHRLIGP